MSRLANRTARLRQLEELLLLSPEGLTAADLARRLQVDRRTIYRDLDFLSDQHVPIWEDAGRYGLNRTRYLTTLRLTYQEAMALVLAGLLLARTLDERNPWVTAALRRLAATLPEFPGEHLKRAADRVESYQANPSQVAVLESILEGWGTGRKLKLAYRSPRSGALRERTVAPYAVVPTAQGLYLIGHDDWADDIRTFKLERLESAISLPESYTIPAEFDLEAHLSSSWGIMTSRSKLNEEDSGSQAESNEVILRFTPEARPFVLERHWHPSQQLEIAQNGYCILSLRVSEPLEMQPWIRSWGAQVEVLAPDWLRERIAGELRQASMRYFFAESIPISHEIEYT